MEETKCSGKKFVLIIAVIFVSMFICSCRCPKIDSCSDNPNQKREDEARKIMRDYYLDSILDQGSNDLTFMETMVLRRMKKDFYYEPHGNENPTYVIPGPSWKVRGPLDLTPFFEQLKEMREKDPSYHGRAFELMDEYKEGDEIFYYISNEYSWNYLMGIEGYVIIRDNKVCFNLIIEVN